MGENGTGKYLKTSALKRSLEDGAVRRLEAALSGELSIIIKIIYEGIKRIERLGKEEVREEEEIPVEPVALVLGAVLELVVGETRLAEVVLDQFLINSIK